MFCIFFSKLIIPTSYICLLNYFVAGYDHPLYSVDPRNKTFHSIKRTVRCFIFKSGKIFIALDNVRRNADIRKKLKVDLIVEDHMRIKRRKIY